MIAALLATATGAAAGDGIALTLTRSGGNVGLAWEGGVPNFELYIAPDAATVTDPLNRAVVTGGRSAIDNSGPPSSGAVTFYRVVSIGPCDPLDPAAICDDGQRCYPTPDAASACAGQSGFGGQFSLCTMDADCSPIHACVDVGGNASCLQWCRVGFGDCTVGSCNALSNPLFVGPQQYGVCV